MSYKTSHGTHYHAKRGCHGAEIPCGTAGLKPCSVCCASPPHMGNRPSRYAAGLDGAPMGASPSPIAPAGAPDEIVDGEATPHLEGDDGSQPASSSGITPEIQRYLGRLHKAVSHSIFLGTPFEKISLVSNKSKGDIFECLVEEFYGKKLHQSVTPSESSDHDRIISGVKTEIKGSSQWRRKSPYFKWQQIRPYQDYEQFVFLAMYPTHIDIFQADKSELLADPLLIPQHNGKHADLGHPADTYWLDGTPDDHPAMRHVGRITTDGSTCSTRAPNLPFADCEATQELIDECLKKRNDDVISYYEGSPFYDFVFASTSTKGAMAEAIAKSFLREHGYDVSGREDGPQADCMLDGHPLEIKAAIRGKSGTCLLWEQIRPLQKNDNHLFMDIDRDAIRFYLVDRRTIEAWVASGRIRNQHGGKAAHGDTQLMPYFPLRNSFLDDYLIGSLHA